ncbi:MAG: hypothetical protein ACE5G8_06785 [Anaerolineae bacterium]
MNHQRPLYVDKVLANLFKELTRSGALIWKLLKHPRVSPPVKIIPVAALLYWFNPLDPLPFPLNIFPLDDLIALLVGYKLFIGLCPPGLVESLRAELVYGPSDGDNEVIDATHQILDDDQ